ncbi:MAG: hypothetical protein JXX28_10365 [Deltaproteobacteria bacterium]|nr:hypothetical protein [Deltaproteobacteria bacterium]
MAVRVRKLARELQHTPGEVLGILHAIGIERYRSPEDMLPTAMADKVRVASRRGVKPVKIAPLAVPAQARQVEAPPQEVDVMAQLVPGVQRHGREPHRPRPAPSKGTAPALSPAPPPPPPAVSSHAPPPPAPVAPTVTQRDRELQRREQDLSARERRLGRDREDFARALARQDLERAALQAELARMRAELEEARAAERVAVDAAAAALATAERMQAGAREEIERVRRSAVEEIAAARVRLEEEGGAPLDALLQERGLSGLEEHGRAVSALFTTRAGKARLGQLRVLDAAGWRATLREALVLTSSDPAEQVPTGWAGVQVSLDRAELPSATELEKRVERVGEIWLLFGYRRVAVMGGGGLWQRLLRAGIDARVEIRFVSPDVGPSELLGWADVLVVWGASLRGEKAQRLSEEQFPVLFVAGETLTDLVLAVEAYAQA